MKCLDTHALVEIAMGNPKFSKYLEAKNFVITDITLAEFYGVILREYDENTADYWFKRLVPYCEEVHRGTLIKAVKYRHENKKKNLSFFDCVGYIFAKRSMRKFVTGDQQFKGVLGVEFVK